MFRLRWTSALIVLLALTLAGTAWVKRQITTSVGMDELGTVLIALVGVVVALELAVGGLVGRR